MRMVLTVDDVALDPAEDLPASVDGRDDCADTLLHSKSWVGDHATS